MSGPQFIRIQTYALAKSSSSARSRSARSTKAKGGRKSASNGSDGWTVADICAEASRQPEASKHVRNPQPPRLLEGVDPLAIPALIASEVKEAKKALRGSGTRIREDTRTLVTLVASYPCPTDLLDNRPENREGYEAWQGRTLAYARKFAAENGCDLVSAVEHTDEAFPHVHIYLLPRHQHGYRADAAHPGKRAKEAAKVTGGNVFDAYKDAMREFQTSFWNEVGLPCGLTRLGPERMRVPRDVYLAHRDDLAAAAKAKRDANTHLAAAHDQAAALVLTADEVAHATLTAAEQDAGQVLADAQEEAAAIRQAADVDRQEALTLREQAQRLLDALRQRFDVVAARFDALVHGGAPQAAPQGADRTKQALGRVFGQSPHPRDEFDALAADLLGPAVRKPAAAEAAARLGSWRRDHDQQPAEPTTPRPGW